MQAQGDHISRLSFPRGLHSKSSGPFFIVILRSPLDCQCWPPVQAILKHRTDQASLSAAQLDLDHVVRAGLASMGDTEPVLSEQQRPRAADDLGDTRAIVPETRVMCCMLSAPPWMASGRPFNSEPHPLLTGSVDGIQRERRLQSSSFRCLRLLTFSLISCFTLLLSWDKICSAKAEKVIQPPSLHVREGLILAVTLAAV